jgi:N-acetylmuramoyl-L-alanine amidase
MIASLLLAVAAAAAPVRPESLVVRLGERAAIVPVFATGDARTVRADVLAEALGGSVRRVGATQFVLALPGVEFRLEPSVPFARVGAEVFPLVAAPHTRGARLHVPMQLAAELLPRLGSGVMYDGDRHELRVFSTQARTSPAAAPRAAAPPAASAEADRPSPRAVPAASGSAGGVRPARAARRLVVVDAGHGGPDRGMTGPIGSPRRITEKDVTLAVAEQVAAALKARGVDVLMTRTTDTLIALADRGRIANAKRGDLFLSIHVNAANPNWREPGRARGFETYFLAEAKTEEESRVERMENEAVRFETGANATKGDPLSFIINDMAQNEHLRESNDLAEAIQRSLGRVHPGPSRGVKQANFAVLRTSFMPAVLIELGFGTNPTEADYLTERAAQRALAESIAEATVDYLGRYSRRVGVSSR